ncbi:hypothetical protein ABPG74_003356 [Tetrahymena malaccensis]
MINRLLLLTIFLLKCLINCEVLSVLHPNPISYLDFKEHNDSTAIQNCISDEENYAYITSTQKGVYVIDLSNLQNPQVISTAYSMYAYGCQVAKNYLFIADLQQGLVIYDVKDKFSPQLISISSLTQNDLQPSFQFVLVSQDLNYVFCASYGFILTYQITNIEKPQLLQLPKDFVQAPLSYTLRYDSSKRFIALANHISGVTILDISNVEGQYIRSVSNPKLQVCDVAFSQNSIALFVLDSFSGLYYADTSILIDDLQPGKLDLVYEQIVPFTDYQFTSMQISFDRQFLFIAFRSLGIKIYQVSSSNHKNLTFIQLLQISFKIFCINISKNSQYLYVTNGLQFQIFKYVLPNLNKEYPNFFNSIQSRQNVINSASSLSCLQNEVIVSSKNDGIKIYDISQPFNLNLYINNIQTQINNTEFGMIAVTKDSNTLFVASYHNGLLAYDITDKSNPQFKNNYQFLNNGTLMTCYSRYIIIFYLKICFKKLIYFLKSVKISKDQSKIVVGNSYYGIIVYMFNNPADLTKLEMTQYYINQQACEFQLCDFTSDASKFACACREKGTIFFQFEKNNQNIAMKYLYQEIYVEQAVISQNDNSLILANGVQGIYIVDITDFFNPKKVSQLLLSGYAMNVNPVFDEKYIIVSQIENGQLSLVNIEDLNNPYEQQRLLFFGEGHSNSCLSSSNTDELYFIGNKGLRSIPILPKISIHSQFQVEVYNINGDISFYKTLDQGQNLLVGQNVRIIFTQLYNEQNIQISKVYYYRQFEKQNLPEWILFQPQLSQISIAVDKLGTFNNFSTEKNGENILILQVQLQITGLSLINDNLKIDKALASRILSLLMQNNIIDSNGYANLKFNPQTPFDLSFYDEKNFTPQKYSQFYPQIQKFIQDSLIFSIIEYPIRFFIKSSLQFNYSQALRQKSISSEIIFTPSKQVSLFMQITSKGKFVKKILEGVIFSFSDDLKSFKISGTTSLVNSYLKNSIKVANQTSDLYEVQITFIIQDFKNYDQTIKISLYEADFIQIHKPVKMNEQKKSLQDQLSLYYSNGNLPIEQDFKFSFDFNTFIQDDGLQISYSAFVVFSDQILQQIFQDSWIKFNNSTCDFYGQRSFSYYLQKIYIRIVADDGYSQTQSDFEIKFTVIPFSYLIQISLKALFCLLSILAVIGRMFEKQIIIYGKIQSDAVKLWNILKKQDKNLFKSLLSEYQINKDLNISNIIQKLLKIYRCNQNKFVNLDSKEFDFQESRLAKSIKRLAYQCILDRDPATKRAFKQLKSHAKKNIIQQDWYRLYITINHRIFAQNSFISQKRISTNYEIKESSPDKISKNLLSPFLLRSRQQSNLSKISQMMFKNDLKNLENSVCFQKHNLSVAKFQENQNKNIRNFNKISVNKQSYPVKTNSLPEILVDTKSLNEAFKVLKFDQSINFDLIQELIILEAYGAILNKPNFYNCCYGESIHLPQNKIQGIVAFSKNKQSGFLQKLKKLFKSEYNQISFQKNNPLPCWLKLDINNGVINIWGIPQLGDEPEIQVRIIGNKGFSVMNINICIQDQIGNNMRDKEYLRKFTYNFNKKFQNYKHEEFNIDQAQQTYSPNFQEIQKMCSQSNDFPLSQEFLLPTLKQKILNENKIFQNSFKFAQENESAQIQQGLIQKYIFSKLADKNRNNSKKMQIENNLISQNDAILKQNNLKYLTINGKDDSVSDKKKVGVDNVNIQTIKVQIFKQKQA